MRLALVVMLTLAVLRPGTAMAQPREEVDLELVIAVDISLSMDYEELRVQRQGYIDALNDPEVIRAVRGGVHGRIAISYIEWAGWGSANVLAPWTVVSGPESARAFTDRVAAAPVTRLRRTSISGALIASMRLFEESPFAARRRVVDVSGDGPNNDGPLVVATRDEAVRRGITINGLPVMISQQRSGWFDVENLDDYYQDCVIGGPGAFMVPVQRTEDFGRAIRTKLIMEISGLEPPPRVVPAQGASRIPCDIGERVWQRWNER
jgi:hypothetical protein